MSIENASPHVVISLSLRCVDCEEVVKLSDTIACGGIRCKTRRCKKCHASRKACRKWYEGAGRTHVWDEMSGEQKREMVVANKDKGSGRGHRRTVRVLETASCEDSLGISADRPFMTKKKFLVKHKHRFSIFHLLTRTFS